MKELTGDITGRPNFGAAPAKKEKECEDCGITDKELKDLDCPPLKHYPSTDDWACHGCSNGEVESNGM